ncbi:MAG: hypothetical protein AB7R90_04155 [Reyranellaceae bacterium]
MSFARRALTVIGLALAIIFLFFPARAEMTFRQLENLYATKQYDILNLYLGGLFEAMSRVVTSYEGDSPEKFFCLPSKIHFEDVHETIAQEIAARLEFYSQNPNTPMTQIAFAAVQRRYPCKT